MKRTLAISLLALAYAAGGWAQAPAGFGAVTGAVVDTYGDGIPDVRVVVTNEKLGVLRNFMTTDDGVFDITSLVPAEGYLLKATRKGYGDWEIRNIQVNLGQALNFRFTMEQDVPATAIEASDAHALVDVTKLGVSGVVSPQQIESVPMPDRRWDNLLPLAPPVGAANVTASATHGPLPSPVVLIDGNNETNSFLEYRGAPKLLSEESVQEFQTISSGYVAEFPGSMGGIINVVTRSGANDYHGSAYDYFRNHSLNAADRYAGTFNPAQHQHQGGVSIGGPILRNKLFFFSNFELIDGHGAALNRITNPLIADPTGNFVLQSNCKATVSQCAAAAKFIQSQMNVVVPRSLHSDNGFIKLDYRRGPRNTFSIDAGGDRLTAPNGVRNELVSPDGSLLARNGNVRQDTRLAKLNWVSTPAYYSVNEMRVGWSLDSWIATANPKLLPSTGALGITVAGTNIGGPTDIPATYPREKRRQFADTLSLSSNTHSVRFGFEIGRTQHWLRQANFAGQYDYATLTAFAQDFSGVTVGRKTYTEFNQQFQYPVRIFPMTNLAGFGQDSWRILPFLTFSYGIRWEKPFLPHPPAQNATYYQTGTIESPNVDASPRFGLALKLNSRTALRGSFGFYYAPYPGEPLDAMMTGNNQLLASVTVTPAMTNAPLFPNVLTWLGAAPTNSKDILYGMHKLRQPHSDQATLSIERDLGHDTALTISGLRIRGFRLWSVNDLNLVAPTTGVNYAVDDASGKLVGTLTLPFWTATSDTNYAHIYRIENGASSWYTAGIVQLNKRMSRGLSVQATYKWSHAIDDAGNLQNGIIGSNTYNWSSRSDIGSSATDQRHRAAISWVWQPRVAGSAPAASRYALNGWSLSGVATLASGLPYTAVTMVSGQQFSTSAVYTNSLNGSGGWNRVPLSEISSLRTQPQYTLDARLSRTFSFGERVKAQVLFEGFNVLNMQHDTGVNTIAYTATSGVLKPVTGLGAGNATWGLIDGTNARRAQAALRISF